MLLGLQLKYFYRKNEISQSSRGVINLFIITMNELAQKYQFDLSQPIATPYQDAQIKNSSYRATRRKDDKPYHLVLYKSKKMGQINSYYKKITKMAQIKSPYLVPILDCIKDEESNQLFIVLEWNQSFSLRDCLKQQTLSQTVAVKIIKDILKGLRQVHKVSILHSFINIQNIQIIQGRARLSFRYLIYKTYYLAPQIKQNHQKSQETDLFSLGVCLYKLIFGSLPFKTKTNEEYIKSVKKGISKKLSLPKCNFPIIVSQQVQDIINTLCHFQPQERVASLHKLQAFQIRESTYNKDLVNAALGEDYELMSIEQVKSQVTNLMVLHPKMKRIYSMDIVQHNLTQLSSYIQDIINPFKNQSNLHFANIKQFFPVLKNSIAIVYSYCAQGSLQTYRKNCAFDKSMIEEVQSLLMIVLTRWVGQYRFLNDQQILIKEGKAVIKFPPYPTSQLKKKLKESQKGNYFYAPQLQSGVQSLSADSWSYGVLEFWMRFDCFPTYDKEGDLIIKNKSKLTPQQIQHLTELTRLKHRDRKNVFPLQAKAKAAPRRKVSMETNSSNSNESPRRSSKLKSSSIHLKNKTLEIKNLSQLPDQQEELSDQIQLMQIDENNNNKNPAQNKRKSRQSDPALYKKKTNDKSIYESSNIKELNVFDQLEGNSYQEQALKEKEGSGLKRRNRRVTKNGDSQLSNQSKLKNNKTDPIQLKETLASPHIKTSTLSEQYSTQNKKMIKKSNRFGGIPVSQQRYSRDNETKKRNSISSKIQTKSKDDKKQNKSSLAVQQAKNERLLDNLKAQAWKLSQIQTHWSKPLRIIVKCLVAVSLYLFIFYLSFLSTNGTLMSNRYNYTTQQLYLKVDKSTVVATINFTTVTRNTSQAYSSLNNQTLDYVLYSAKCITNRYWTNSIILTLIQGSSFATYSIVGILIVLVNLLMVILVIAKLDFPKAISYCQMDDNNYVALQTWLIVNLGVSTSTSMIFILYGGLFELQLDPCISWTNFPSLQLLFRGDTSSFALKFSWVYIGMIVAWIIMIYLLVKPKNKLHKYVYGVFFLFYIGTAGARSLSAYNGTKQSIIGACGQLLTIVIGAILLIFDMIVGCCLRKLPKGAKNSATVNEQIQLNVTEVDLHFKK